MSQVLPALLSFRPMWRNRTPKWNKPMNVTSAPRPVVISTEVEKSHAGMEQPHECHKCSPPRCHFDRSGEISRPSGTSRMAVGDFSTLSLSRAQIPISPYLHAAPLEMTCGAASFTVMEKKNKWTGTSPAPLSFRPQRSGVEKSHAGIEQPHECHKCSPPRCHFDRSGEISRPKRPDAPILRRFQRHPLPKEGGYKLRQSRHLPPERQRTQPFYTTRRRQAAPTCAVRRAPF